MVKIKVTYRTDGKRPYAAVEVLKTTESYATKKVLPDEDAKKLNPLTTTLTERRGVYGDSWEEVEERVERMIEKTKIILEKRRALENAKPEDKIYVL